MISRKNSLFLNTLCFAHQFLGYPAEYVRKTAGLKDALCFVTDAGCSLLQAPLYCACFSRNKKAEAV